MRLLLSLAPVALSALACTLGGGPTERSNASACAAYADALNAQLGPCGLAYDADNFCSSAAYPDVDMQPYYACLVAHARCDGGALVLDTDGCAPPLLVAVDARSASAETPANTTAALPSGEEGAR
ncbi:MAG: hypothetical protein R3F59_07085 [Myxococcota bacterium]